MVMPPTSTPTWSRTQSCPVARLRITAASVISALAMPQKPISKPTSSLSRDMTERRKLHAHRQGVLRQQLWLKSPTLCCSASIELAVLHVRSLPCAVTRASTYNQLRRSGATLLELFCVAVRRRVLRVQRKKDMDGMPGAGLGDATDGAW
ncbi:hypothetical protein EJ03DRAFT_12910 [Teratosphaeria nubilosa]|uniref:Uncharacterized protein n=1 Tax=Teratosphaeria nubilosa TaxID=161662 RepID=A0A6G1KXV1_9PEZI|nr:hypothetical protein EJ03DRAFT_12910 [Teratosphaeria nubilosa]